MEALLCSWGEGGCASRLPLPVRVHRMRHRRLFVAVFGLALVAVSGPAAPAEYRSNLVHALLSEDLAEQRPLIQKLAGAEDPLVPQVLSAWRGGAVYLQETNGRRTPFFLDAQTDAEGKARG